MRPRQIAAENGIKEISRSNGYSASMRPRQIAAENHLGRLDALEPPLLQ